MSVHAAGRRDVIRVPENMRQFLFEQWLDKTYVRGAMHLSPGMLASNAVKSLYANTCPLTSTPISWSLRASTSCETPPLPNSNAA
jgi:hypothetical protein